jgi:hypothetical protein
MRSTLLALSLAAAASGCVPGGTSPASPQDTERQRWETAALDDYRYDFQQQCFCIREQVQPVTIEVRDGRVHRVVSRETGSVVADPNLRWPTVPELFEIAAEARGGGAEVEVRYDARLGYPTHIQTGSLANDAGVVYTASGLRPLDE